MVQSDNQSAGVPGEGNSGTSRRSMLFGSGSLLVGGIVGRATVAEAAPQPQALAAPPLPWPWTRLDPMEAGTRAYKTYLTKKG